MAIAGAKTTPLAALPPSEKRPNVLLAALGVRIADRFEKIIEAFPAQYASAGKDRVDRIGGVDVSQRVFAEKDEIGIIAFADLSALHAHPGIGPEGGLAELIIFDRAERPLQLSDLAPEERRRTLSSILARVNVPR
ncbi:MAG: hypothetical protein AB7E24_04665 [Novosphingobium sp.]